MIRYPRKHRRNRRKLDPSQVPIGPFVNWSLGVGVGDTLEVTAVAPVMMMGLPHITVNGVAPVSAVQVTPTVIRLTYPSPVSGTDEGAIPDCEEHVRTPFGGYLMAGFAQISP